MNSLTLYKKLDSLPASMKEEVADFIDFLATKAKKKKSLTSKSVKPTFGSAKGLFTMCHDFDDPLDDFQEYM